MKILIRYTVVLALVSFCTLSAFGQQPDASSSRVITFGDPKAQHRIEVFYDLQCGACAAFHEKLKAVLAKSGDKVFVIFRHFPLAMHDRAFMASSIAEAARRQGKGVEMIDFLLNEQAKWSTSDRPYKLVFEYADKLGLDKRKLKADVLDDDVIRTVLLDINRAKQLGVSATPTVFLNGKALTYPESLELDTFISKGN